MESINLVWKLFILAMLAAVISSTSFKEWFDPTGQIKICEVRGITSPEDLWKESDHWVDCARMKFIDSNFSDIMFSRALIFLPGYSLKQLDFVNVGFREIRQRDFGDLDGLQYLNMSGNKISRLPSQIFSQLPSLISVDLSLNLINSVNETAFSRVSPTLKLIDLSFNNISKFNESCLTHLNHNMSVNLEGNLMNEFMQMPKNSSVQSRLKLKHLNLQNNTLSHFKTSTLEIEELNLNNNHLTKFTITEQIVKVSLKNNKIAKLKFDSNATIESLNLSGNNLLKKSLDRLKQAKQLKVLDLSNNQLQGMSNETFANMTLLEDLNLAASGLSNLSSHLLLQQENLKVLNVSCNNLSSIDFHFFGTFKNLEILDISGNNLTKFENFSNSREHFPRLKMITLEDNDWNSESLSTLIEDFILEGINVNKFTPECSKNAAIEPETPEKSSFLLIIMIIAIIFLVVSAGFVLYYLKFKYVPSSVPS